MMPTLQPGQRLGIMGTGAPAQQLATVARQAGLQVLSAPATPAGASNPLANPSVSRAFAQQCDLVTSVTQPVAPAILSTITQYTRFPQGSELTELSRDRALEQAFFQSLNLNTRPVQTVITADDVNHAIATLGLPAQILPIIKDSSNQDGISLQTPADVAQFSPLAGQGSYLYVPTVDVQHQFVVLATKAETGELELFPPVAVAANGRLLTTMATEMLDSDLAAELQQATSKVGQALTTVGSFGVAFLLTTTGLLYVTGLQLSLPSLTVNLSRGCNFTPAELHVRALSGLPLPTVEQLIPQQWCGFATNAEPAALVARRQHPDWEFDFSYRSPTDATLTGGVWVSTTDPERTKRQLQQSGLLNLPSEK
ncbi:ATP-grasp domain-containing protein [Fructilactobacillus myrtifloralis]|uniref:ATP-grasp domain-containing protein n=1 Tax=Fructilactobacillus myrtifloralis TaxID=2940301 RepID=A0ABY5BQY9_9LACO|nr:ATP-grasp domain-containing protein [Fructilactobacillus myrtifloralis]USS85606.1 ATP-grasp domain-containing protein [Fructilactobacillus myrtifloralis]